jgi:hypothetical protein
MRGVKLLNRGRASPAHKFLALDREQQAEMVGALVPRLGKLDQKIREFRAKLPEGVKRWNPHMEPGWFDIWYPRSSLNNLLESLLARKLPLGSARLAALATWCASCEFLTTYYCPVAKWRQRRRMSPIRAHWNLRRSRH